MNKAYGPIEYAAVAGKVTSRLPPNFFLTHRKKKATPAILLAARASLTVVAGSKKNPSQKTREQRQVGRAP